MFSVDCKNKRKKFGEIFLPGIRKSEPGVLPAIAGRACGRGVGVSEIEAY
jgi:hypothetical protein